LEQDHYGYETFSNNWGKLYNQGTTFYQFHGTDFNKGDFGPIWGLEPSLQGIAKPL